MEDDNPQRPAPTLTLPDGYVGVAPMQGPSPFIWKFREREQALNAVIDWMNGKPTENGWKYPHGAPEIRKIVQKALKDDDQTGS